MVGVGLFDLAFTVNLQDRKETGPVEVEVRVEVFLMKFIELWCPVARDMVIAEVLADDRAILGFG